MLILLLDEPGLLTFATVEEAVAYSEAIDVENGLIRAAFDDEGVPYRVEWSVRPRKRAKWWGLVTWRVPGEYTLVPSGAPDRAALLRLLDDHLDQTDPEMNLAHLRALRDECARLVWPRSK